MSPKISSGELRDDMSANSSMVMRSRRRCNELKTKGRASVMKPGLEPVLCNVERPREQADSIRSRTAGSSPAGRWNSLRVDTTLAPASSRRHRMSTSARSPMKSTQSGRSARICSTSSVATTPVSSRPHSVPASRPTLSGE